MPHASTTVANRFIELATRAGNPLTPLQIIKLTYIAHGWSLALLGRPLVSEGVEAWKYGPVLPSLYRFLKQYGSGPVTRPVNSLFASADRLNAEETALVDDVYAKYAHLSGVQLSSLTHQAGSPWSKTYEPKESHTLIPDNLIARHYRRLADER